MSKTVAQIFATNPTTVVADTDLYYLVQSPYTPGSDAAISGASLKAAFGTGGTISPGLINQLGYYAAAGSTISGLATLANGTLITSAGGTPSISQTLPSVVQGNITSLGTISSGIWQGTIIGGTYGGTGINNGASTITLGGSLTTSGAFASTFTMTNTTNVTFPTSGTLATIAQLPTLPLSLASGGTGAALVANNGGIFYSNASTGAILAGTATAQQLLMSGASTTPQWSTTTYPLTNAINTIMFASSANVLGSITAANNGTLITSATGVPSWLANGTTGQILTATTGSPPSWVAPAGVTLLTTKGDLFGFSTVNARVPVGTTNGQVLQVNSANANGLSYSTPTYPNASGATGAVLISDGTNYIASTSLWPNTVGTSRKVVISNGTSNVYSTETYAVPGTSGNVMTSDGTNWTSAAPAVTTVLTTKGDILGFSTVDARIPVGSTNGQILQVNSANAVGVGYSTPTYPSGSATSGLFLVSDGTNFVASAKAAFTTINIQTFSSSGTYTPTTGMKYCVIECVGPGGAGGGAASSTGQGFGGGGGAGAYSRKFSTAATVGGSQIVTVGTGGSAGTAGNNPGGNGSAATSVGVICTAGAGTGGGGAAANSDSAGGAGGVVGTGDLSVAGNAGTCGMGGSIITLGGTGGLGGAGPWGGVAVGANATTLLTGNAGNGPGTGGNGGGSTATSAAKAGGAGANGYVIITEYIYA